MIIYRKAPAIHSKKNNGPYAYSNSVFYEIDELCIMSIPNSIDDETERILVIESKKTWSASAFLLRPRFALDEWSFLTKL